MGSDFLKRTKPTILKHIDSHRMRLATADLLTVLPVDQPRCLVASLEGSPIIVDGATIIAEPAGNAIRLRQGNSYVGKLDNPPADILARVTATGGAGATIQRIHKISRKVEVSLQ